MVKLLWRTDVHISDKSPLSRKDEWLDTVLGKLVQVGEIARSEGCHAVIDGGDFFHHKPPSRNSHRMMVRIAQVHNNYPCPVFANIGNHDCVHGDYRYLDQQPLGVLFTSGIFNRLYDNHEVTFREGGVTVRVVGVPYHGTAYDLSRLDIKKGKEDYLVVAAHLLASPEGGSMFESEDIVRYSDLKSLDPDVFMFGHWHKDQGVTEILEGKWVVNVGSLTRGSLSQDHLQRKPACVCLSFSPSGVSLKRIDIDVKDAAEVFRIEDKSYSEIRNNAIDAFSDRILAHKNSWDAHTKISLEDSVASMAGIEPELRELAIHYLQLARK